MHIQRRSFLRLAVGTAAGGALGLRRPLFGAPQRSATDIVLLGPDKVRLSRLATGLGTISGSVQRKLGLQGLADYLHWASDQGITYWDTADAYRTHPHVNEALKSVPREKVAIMSKARASTAEQMRADLDRFRKELNTDYIDIVLMHAITDANWPENLKGPMDVLAEAREKGVIRTHGLSCHSLDALQTAVKTPWAHVVLSRINPAGARMDGQPAAVVPVLRQLKAAGKGVIGMKILGEGSLRDRVDECLRYVMSLDCVDCFTIGAADRDELADLIKRIPAASQMPAAA